MKLNPLFIILFLFLFSCTGNSNTVQLNKYAVSAFGSTIKISYTGEEIDGLNFAMENLIADFNRSLSTYDSTSVVSRINRNETDKIDSLNFKLLAQALWWTRATGGAFDVCVAPLVDLWGFGKTKPHPVDSSQVDSARSLGGYNSININQMVLVKKDPGVRINYNAIAPGFAADLISDMLIKRGRNNYYINVGGEVRCSGVNQDSAYWLIGIEKPIENKNGENEAMRNIRVINQALATSGNYRQFYEVDGKKYAHTLDPRTGYPVQHDLLSATVLAPDASTADALATICMVLGREEAKVFFEQLQNVHYYFIYRGEDGSFKEEWSPGLEKQFVED
ncbi:MAG TPA: thiamine biosynthesis protein ApbE [Bacteroidetes bacterium]|nr:thiamine biosynthesis protein ApbE [Bacteroidota bacterium]